MAISGKTKGGWQISFPLIGCEFIEDVSVLINQCFLIFRNHIIYVLKKDSSTRGCPARTNTKSCFEMCYCQMSMFPGIDWIFAFRYEKTAFSLKWSLFWFVCPLDHLMPSHGARCSFVRQASLRNNQVAHGVIFFWVFLCANLQPDFQDTFSRFGKLK